MKNTHKVKARLAVLNHKGFTLVEVLIALLVLGIIFVPVSNVFLQSVYLNQHLKQRVEAIREAQTAMEVTLSLLNNLDSTEAKRFDATVAKHDHVEPENIIEEQIIQLLAGFDIADLVMPDTTVELAPLHEDSPFIVITATSADTHTGLQDSTYNFTLTTLHLPGEAPWLTPTEYRVVTP